MLTPPLPASPSLPSCLSHIEHPLLLSSGMDTVSPLSPLCTTIGVQTQKASVTLGEQEMTDIIGPSCLKTYFDLETGSSGPSSGFGGRGVNWNSYLRHHATHYQP